MQLVFSSMLLSANFYSDTLQSLKICTKPEVRHFILSVKL